jgi:2-oxoisovalerate dehydrogenase E2 component (dihydrolipoyl transacylase)
MSEYVFRLPDLGEGTVEAEIIEWHVSPGDTVAEGDIIADVMTDKANVEVPAPVAGRVLRTTGEPGDMIAVGAELIAFETAGGAAASPAVPEPQPQSEKEPETQATPAATEGEPAGSSTTSGPVETRAPTGTGMAIPTPPPEPVPQSAAEPAPAREYEVDQLRAQVRTSPAVRRRAKEAGIDLTTIAGTGPGGRILRKDLEAALTAQVAGPTAAAEPAPSRADEVEEIKVIGVRRVIANRLQAAKQEIPHFAYVEEVDITRLESLRARLNAQSGDARPSLTYLPFIALALIRALKDYPQCNAHFDGEAGLIRRFARVHLGIATQTPDGLKVPVVHNADRLPLWALAAEIGRVAEAARDNTATRAELTGSTITLTSLGRLGGIVSTPVINAPEVAIIGVNKAVERPMVVGDQIATRLMMNLSSSFDHRFVDGFDAASLIQELKNYLEEPATIFIDG